MATFVKFQQFSDDLARGVHQCHAAGHTLNIYFSNTTPDSTAHTVKADLAEISTGNGYAGPQDTQNDSTRVGSTTHVTGVDVTVTASGGTVGPFRYVVLYNDTPTNPADPLIGYWDYSTNLTLQTTEPFVTDFGAELFKVIG